jgi:lysophospholipase L1-like esterase
VVRRLLFIAIVTVIGIRVTHAQLADPYTLPRPANCCLLNTATTLAEQLQDWNQLSRYHEANRELSKLPAVAGRVVFLGDSITDGWRLEEAFPGKPYVNRGISGQTTAQMLVRFYPDVLALKPAAVAILAGTNDIARNNGPQTLEMIQHNIMAMTELANGHGVKVVLGAVMPISDRTMMPAGRGGGPGGGRGGAGATPRPRIQSVQRPPADIVRFNDWLKRYAAEKGAVYADYYTATVDAQGFFREGYTNDGLHPNAQGYTLMNPVVSAAIDQALK